MRKTVLMFTLMALFALANTAVAQFPTCGANCPNIALFALTNTAVTQFPTCGANCPN
jgi:hypothetical protein